MPTLGNLAVESTSQMTIENLLYLNRHVMPEGGQIVSVTPWLFESFTNSTHYWHGLLYTDSFTLLAQTNTYRNVDTIGGWYEGFFATPIDVASGTPIWVGVGGSGGGGTAFVAASSYQAAYCKRTGFTYPTFPNPATVTDDTVRLSVYATYNTVGGGEAILGTIRLWDVMVG